MDFLNNATSQLRELYDSMTAGARIVAVLLLAVVVVSIVYLFKQGGTGPDEYLFGGEALPAGQLNTIEAAIASAGLSGHQRDGRGIRVPSHRKSEFMAAVANEGAIPLDFHTILGNALASSGPFETSDTKRQRLRIAKQQTLSEIVRSMDWVENAAILYDAQQPSGIRRATNSTATVNVLPVHGEPVNARRKRALQRLVAYSFAGLQPESVVVTSLGSDSLGGDGADFEDVFEGDYYPARVAWERYTRNKIIVGLANIPGVRVEVNAILDSLQSQREDIVKPDPTTAQAREIFSKSSLTKSEDDGGGPPGETANGPTPNRNTVATARTKTTEEHETGDAQNVVGHTIIQKSSFGMVPKEVWATVAVPTKYAVDVWKLRNPTPAGQEPREPNLQDLNLVFENIKTKIEKLVEPLLDGPKGEDSFKHVQVEFVDSIEPEALPEPSVADTAMAWTGRHWGTLSMMGFAMFSMLLLRSIVKAPPANATPDGVPGLTLELGDEAGSDGSGDDGDGSADDSRPKLKLTKGATLKDDLVEIVREDPDAAAAILRSWIGKAA